MNYGAGWVIERDRVWHNGALSPLGIYAYVGWSTTDDEVVVLLSSVDVSSVQPELRKVVEAALNGEPVPDVTGRTGVIGTAAMLSAWRVHQALALLVIGATLALLGRPKTRLDVLAAASTGGGIAAGLLAFTGLLPATVAAILPVVAGAVRARSLPTGRGSAARTLLAGVSVLAAGISFAALLAWLAGVMADPWALLATAATDP